MRTGFLFADILLADTDADFVRQTRAALQNAGYTVRRVEQSAALFESALERPPDLLLLAAGLPGMVDYDVVRRLKTASTLPFIPIIMLGAAENTDDLSAALNAGADEFLRKPVSNAELLVRVRAMLRFKQSTDALRELNATLEQRVLERTHELEEAHARLRHTEKLSALGNLAASVAHDINNPLTGILTYLYVMKQAAPANTDLAEDLDFIERQVLAIGELVKQLQNFAKPPRAARRPLALRAVADDVATLMRKDLQKHRIEMVCEGDAPEVLAAPDQMGEVFLNLVVNARDAMPEGGVLTVQVDVEAAYARVRVSDTGVGIPEDIAAHIFEPFFTTKGEKGTGLGLAICYRIVQEHGGDIAVASQPGQGTTFTVRLPLIAA